MPTAPDRPLDPPQDATQTSHSSSPASPYEPVKNGSSSRSPSRTRQRLDSAHDGSSTPKKARGKGLTEGDQDMESLPDNNLLIVMPAIGLVLFLSALDISIVSTALPTIAEDLSATPSEYSWVGTSYLLGATVMTPLNGRVSDIVGRKPMMYAAILTFTVFSALCGAAQNITWLIVARALQGLGGGSIIALVNMLIADIVPLHKRGTYQGWIGGTWGIASTLGPVFGGLLTQRATWRWCFFINLPTCGISFVALLLTLKLNPRKKLTFREFRETFDFLGMGLLVVGAGLTVVGFSQAADHGFGDASAYGVIIAGVVLLILAVIVCLFTKRNAVIPARVFKIRTTLFFMIGSMLHATAFIPSNYLLPEMFQGVRGSNALKSGVELLPYSVLTSLGTVIAGNINSKLRIVRPVVWAGYSLSALSFGLFYGLYRWPFSEAVQEGILALAGLAVGLGLSAPLLIMQAAMPLKEMASTTTAWQLTRSLGGSIGLALFTAILNTQLRSRFPKIEGYGTDFKVPESASGYAALQALPDGPMKTAVLAAFADSLGVCWIISAALFIAALLITLPTKSYSLNRVPGKGAQAEDSTELKQGRDVEEGIATDDKTGDADVPESPDRHDGDQAHLPRDRFGSETPASEKTIVDTNQEERSKKR